MGSCRSAATVADWSPFGGATTGRECLVAWHGFLMKAAPTVVTGVVGVAAYEAVRTAVAKVPLRTATVAVTAWGIRAAREAQRTAETNTEQIRLTVADVVAEARERAGEDTEPAIVTSPGDGHDD